ncbi:MAG: RibD family protein [Anaerolineales bacterium]|nr:RibD family protein [Chloroflexota bacterium]MBL6981910.1 RibD family protein [Anaerolineales bacterium]
MQAVEDFIRLVESERDDQDRPLVTLTYAQSLDGSIATERGNTLALSGPKSLKITHRLRAMHEGILIGIGTVLSDDPSLTVRLVDGESPQPIILDSRLRFPTSAKLLKTTKRPWIFTGADAGETALRVLENSGCKIFQINSTDRRTLSLPEVLNTLHTLGINRLMVEGGASVIRSFLTAGVVDVVVLTIAPLFIGGLKAVEELISNSHSASAFPRLSPVFVDKVGADILVWGQLSK